MAQQMITASFPYNYHETPGMHSICAFIHQARDQTPIHTRLAVSYDSSQRSVAISYAATTAE